MGDGRTVLLTTTEAAQYLGVSKRTVERLVEEGRLRWFRLGERKGRRYKAVDLDEALTPVEAGVDLWPWQRLQALATAEDSVLARAWREEAQHGAQVA